MSAPTKYVWKIRNVATGQYYTGGAYGHWNGQGKSYATAGAAKNGHGHYQRGYGLKSKCELVQFAIQEVKAEELQ